MINLDVLILSILGYLKIYGSKDLNIVNMRQKLEDIMRECYIDVKIYLDISI